MQAGQLTSARQRPVGQLPRALGPFHPAASGCLGALSGIEFTVPVFTVKLSKAVETGTGAVPDARQLLPRETLGAGTSLALLLSDASCY